MQIMLWQKCIDTDETGVLGVGGGVSIPIAILPSCQDMKTIALQLHKHEHSLVVHLKHLRGSTQVSIHP